MASIRPSDVTRRDRVGLGETETSRPRPLSHRLLRGARRTADRSTIAVRFRRCPQQTSRETAYTKKLSSIGSASKKLDSSRSAHVESMVPLALKLVAHRWPRWSGALSLRRRLEADRPGCQSGPATKPKGQGADLRGHRYRSFLSIVSCRGKRNGSVLLTSTYPIMIITKRKARTHRV